MEGSCGFLFSHPQDDNSVVGPLQFPQQICHPDRSAAEWSDLRFSFLIPQNQGWHQCSLRRVLATKAGRPGAAFAEPFRKPKPQDSRTQSWVAIL